MTPRELADELIETIEWTTVTSKQREALEEWLDLRLAAVLLRMEAASNWRSDAEQDLLASAANIVERILDHDDETAGN